MVPLGNAPRPARLVVDNPGLADLRIDAVDGDGCVEVARPGTVAHFSVDVVPGAYVVRARTSAGDVALPAPLFEVLVRTQRTLTVRVQAPPPAAASDREFAWIPPGPAAVGDLLGIGQEDERPARIVDVEAFWLARTEVTNAEFAAFLTAVEPTIDAAVRASFCAFDSRKCKLARDDTTGLWTSPAPREPVVTVSLAGARAYCAWRTRVTGLRHRLPSEIEWEKAARGPESFVFAYGNTYRRFAANQESGSLREVGSFAANGFGLVDMTGNAFEWTADAYHSTPSAQARPSGLAPPAAPTAAESQVLRGGSFVLDGVYLRNSFRMRQSPAVRTDDIGFRVAHDDVEAAEERPR